MKKRIRNTVCLWTMLLLMSTLTACSDEALPAAAGEHAVLEKLAQAYRKIGEGYPMQPQAMAPKGRREFVKLVFRQAGYSYSATLIALANTAVDGDNKDQRDLAELLLLPAKGLADKVLAKSYSAEELAAVKRLQDTFR